MAKIFVYGTLKRGCCRSHLLEKQRFLGEARTEARYRLYNTGTFPALVEAGDGVPIEGEVWEVDEECLALLDAVEDVPLLYERKPVALEHPPTQDVQTYLYRRSVVGLGDCGCCWDDRQIGAGREAFLADGPLYLAEVGRASFEKKRMTVDLVCAGDSITGWNNFGPAALWPFPTYPRFLQALCAPRGLRLADGGIAGELSDNGLGHVRRYLGLFPVARLFIIGFGTNDLGTWPDLESTSQRIIDNLGKMVQAILDRGKRAMLFNVPHVNDSMIPRPVALDARAKRDYHNGQLDAFCRARSIPLVDVCSHLRDEHFGDELHPNEAGAKIIAQRVFDVLCTVPLQSLTL